MKTKDDIKKMVRSGYGQIARQQDASCCGGAPLTSCCGSPSQATQIGQKIGYTEEDLRAVPEGANLGLGCGNPVALASLKAGETVLDLGSGGGFDCFLAAQRVGDRGRVIGVDMTADMIDRARSNARKGGYKNVEFRLGEIENLPAADGSVDAVISNCVINLSPDKKRVFEEVFRVLKPGGRVMVSDIVLLKPLPKAVQESIAAYVGCLAGASQKAAYLKGIEDAGFQQVKTVEEKAFPMDAMVNDPTAQVIAKNLKLTAEDLAVMANSVLSMRVSAVKPG